MELGQVEAFRVEGSEYLELKEGVQEIAATVVNSDTKIACVDLVISRLRGDVSNDFYRLDTDFCKICKMAGKVFILEGNFGLLLELDSKMRPSSHGVRESYLIGDIGRDDLVDCGNITFSDGRMFHLWCDSKDNPLMISFLLRSVGDEIVTSMIDEEHMMAHAMSSVKSLGNVKREKLRSQIESGEYNWEIGNNPFEDEAYG